LVVGVDALVQLFNLFANVGFREKPPQPRHRRFYLAVEVFGLADAALAFDQTRSPPTFWALTAEVRYWLPGPRKIVEQTSFSGRGDAAVSNRLENGHVHIVPTHDLARLADIRSHDSWRFCDTHSMQESDHEAAARNVYDHSATKFVAAIGTKVSSQFETPLDRAVLQAFAESVLALGSGPVLDVGCGPGRIAAFLAERGIEAGGVDIAPQMIAEARLAHPDLGFEVGTLTELPVPDRSLLGAAYWYSIIATPPANLGAVWQELDRVLGNDGQGLVAFQAGEGEGNERSDAYGSSTTFTLYQQSPDDVIASLNDAGFEVRAEVRRQAELSHETTPQAFLLFARR